MTIRGLIKTLCLDDLAAADAGRADAHVLVSGSHFGMNRAQINVPAPLGHVVGVADGISKLRSLAANIANSCHNYFILPNSIAEVSLRNFSLSLVFTNLVA
jgi:hypothetical protein